MGGTARALQSMWASEIFLQKPRGVLYQQHDSLDAILMFSLCSELRGTTVTNPSGKPLPDQISLEVDAVIAEFDGDPRAAIAALLHDLSVLASDAEASTSRGYVRGRVVHLSRKSTKSP